MTQIYKFISIFLFLIFMSSCSNQSNEFIDSSIAHSASTNMPQNSNGVVRLAIDAFGGIFKTSCYTDNGYYDQLNSFAGAINIMYTDFATRQRVYLCNKPECFHNNDNCTSWFAYSGGVNLFSSNSSKKIFLLSLGFAESELKDKSQFGRIETLDLDGSNRQTLYTLLGNEAFTDAVAIDDKYIYATVVLNNKNGQQTKEIRRINLISGNSETIYNFKNISERVFGAYSNYLIIENATATNKYFHTINTTSNEKSQNIYGFEYSEGIRFELIFNDTLISLRQKSEQVIDIYSFNFSNCKEELLASDFKIYNFDAVYIKNIFDNKVLIEVTNNTDVNNIVFDNYSIDLDSKKLSKIELSYKFYADTCSVAILAEYRDEFLVGMGIEQGTITLIDNAGVPYVTETAIPIHALISKENYWNGNPVYEIIENKIP